MKEKWKRSRTEVTLIRQDEVVDVIEEVEEKRVGKKYEKRKEDIRTRRMSWRRKIEGRRNQGIKIDGKKENDGEQENKNEGYGGWPQAATKGE